MDHPLWLQRGQGAGPSPHVSLSECDSQSSLCLSACRLEVCYQETRQCPLFLQRLASPSFDADWMWHEWERTFRTFLKCVRNTGDAFHLNTISSLSWMSSLTRFLLSISSYKIRWISLSLLRDSLGVSQLFETEPNSGTQTIEDHRMFS